MITTGYLVIAAAAFACLVWCWRAWRATPNATLLLILVPLGLLWFDSFAIAVGRFVGEGPLLTAMTYARYGWHWATLPLYLIVAGMIARRAGYRWAQPKAVMALFCIAAAAFVAVDLPHLWQVEFYPACYGETLRLVIKASVRDACDPAQAGLGTSVSPAAAIAVNLVLLAVGIGLWRTHRFPWLALACLAMFAAAAVPPSLVGPMLGNAGEPVFSAGLIAAGIRFGGLPVPHRAAPVSA